MSRALCFGNDINTDYIVPGEYLNVSDPKILASVCMEGYERGYSKKIKKGDVIVAGENFGCGSSREHAPISIKAAGVSCIIARSFARIFFRNAINIGLPVIEAEEAPERIKEGDVIKIDFDKGEILNKTRQEVYPFHPLPPFMMEIIQGGGMTKYIERKRKEGSKK